MGALLGGSPSGAKPTAAPAPAEAESTGAEAAGSEEKVRRVPLQQVVPCPFQPRKSFAPEALQELADSIREQGIVQPLVVRARGEHYELIAGERRWRAAQKLGLSEVPVLVREADDQAVMELALIENLQRENLNPIEEAQGFAQLIEQFHLRQEDAAAKVGKSRVSVANALRLLKLPPEVQGWVRDGSLSVGHAKVILSLDGAALQSQCAQRVLKGGLNVRQAEDLVATLQKAPPSQNGLKTGNQTPAPPRDPNVGALEERLQERLGTKVQLRYRQGKGAIEIRFFNEDDLDRVLQIIGIKMD